MKDIILSLLYLSVTYGTAWTASLIFRAELSTNHRTRDLNIEWLGSIMGIVTGLFWPVTIPIFIIWAGMVK